MNRLLLLLLISSIITQAQESHDEHHHVGISGGITGVFPENNYIPGAHIHYSYLFKIKNIQMGIGAGLEYLMDKHQHIGTDLSLSFFPAEDFELNIAPGVVFANNNYEYATHIEIIYNFDINLIHLGPVIETAFSKDDFHLSVGIHMGIGL